jgi:aryl-alcohol dehydrogenase-like predicted oxidoreductase
MSFGDPDRGTHPWTLGEERSRELIAYALELGLTFFDTANVYSDGSGEEILGRALRDMANRDEIVLATKVFGVMGSGPNRRGLSRKAIVQEVDASLRRLGTDRVDLLQIHRFDPEVPLEETLVALDDLVRAGKVLYLGASSMRAWQFVEARERQRELGLAPFISMQNQYSLIYREDERDLLHYCAHAGVGVLPWSPLGRGKLTRPWGTETRRTETDLVAQENYRQAVDSDHAVVDVVQEVAAERGVPMAHVALAWLRQQPAVTAPIVGATDERHLRDAVDALRLVLDDSEIARLSAPYLPRLPEQL